MKNKLFWLLLIGSIKFSALAQFSKTHYIPPLSNSNSIVIGNQYIYISTPSITPINALVKEIGGNTIIATVSRDQPFVYDTNGGTFGQLFIEQSEINTVQNNKGYIIEAEDVVYVSLRVDTADGFQAGALLSKGLASLGTEFRIGGFLNTLMSNYTAIHHTFVTVLATENDTEITFSNIKPNATLINSTTGNNPFTITLNSGESYAIAVQGPGNTFNRDALIGSLVTSNKPIVVNCGSIGGTNGELNNIDLGFDQIVGSERVGSEYIFLKNTGQDNVERVLVIANQDNTGIYINGSTTPAYTINAGEYVGIIGSEFSSDGILYIRAADPTNINTPKSIFAYQSVGDNSFGGQANQEMFFVPPLSCQTPKVINTIPLVQNIGDRIFTGRVTLTTKTGSTLSFTINGTDYTLASLSSLGVNIQGPIAVSGNSNYECYILTGLTGNVAALSTSELYLAAYGSDGAATFGGYYSGFTFNPEISFNRLDLTSANCIPNTNLAVNSLSPFDEFIWYFNNTLIPGETTSSLNPTVPGYYKVSATIDGCGTPKESDNIPVSLCPIDSDSDGVSDNLDLDNDNDGVTNCNESYGNQSLNLTNNPVGFLQIEDYLNTYVTTVATTGTGAAATPFIGTNAGNFSLETSSGRNNSSSYNIASNNPWSLSVEYSTAASVTDLLSAATEVRVTCPVNKTLTVLNPNNQILIDTNFDGIFETGVTQFSSFEIRFRLNGNVALPSGTGTFTIKGDRIDVLKITNINLTETEISKVALHITATCVQKDSDNDGIADQYDYDSDNDTIPDLIENQGANYVVLTGIDANKDGIDDVFGSGISPADSDGDSYPNYIDLDSDNDGIFDIIESGSPGNSTNTNGITVGDVGTNGLDNTLETSPNSGIINYTVANTNGAGMYNYISLDSDGDGCNDVIEAGFLDPNNDGILGDDAPIIILDYGLVFSNTGYDVPNINYTISAPIIIIDQPQNEIVCELGTGTFFVNAPLVDSFQWQISTDDGTTWTNLTNDINYTGVNTNNLNVLNVVPTTPNHQFRVFLNRTGNSCGDYSTKAIITTFELPQVTSPIEIKQCDDDTDGISKFNLTQKNNFIVPIPANFTFNYYTSLVGANDENNAFLISNPLAFTSGNATVFARVENNEGCFKIAEINLTVSVTQIPASFAIPIQYQCDDYIDAINNDLDGISSFDFTTIKNDLEAILPADTAILFYQNQADFLAETDSAGNSLAIVNLSDYRNSNIPIQQTIWIRVDNEVDNSCFGFKTFEIRVVAAPKIKLQDSIIICLPNSETIINAAIIDGSSSANYTYQWSLNGSILPGETSYSLSLNTAGTYSVLVTSIFNCSSTRVVEVVASQIAMLESIEISDLSDNNSVIVNVTGLGDYEYAIDDIAGPYSSSNIFTNLTVGVHNIYVRDINKCGILGPLPIIVMGIPHYFTPNGDGYHDTWNIKGVNSPNLNSIIYIFDRYGKLIKQINAGGLGWDGTYKGKLMPAADYWYDIHLKDGRNAKGHFSLLR